MNVRLHDSSMQNVGYEAGLRAAIRNGIKRTQNEITLTLN